MGLINIDLKSEGIDPATVSDILSQVDAIVKRVNWLTLAAESILKQLATKFSFTLTPGP